MDTPVVELPRSFRESVEGRRWPQEDALQPDRKGFNGFRRSTGLGVNFDNVRGVPWAVVFGEAGHGALLQLLDPLDLALKTVADVNGETGILGVENVPLRAAFEGVSVGLDKVLESVDPGIELPYFGHVIIFSLFDCFEQRLGDSLQSVWVEVGAAVEDISS